MPESLNAAVLPRLYRDSVTLMALAAAIEKVDGVLRVGAVMGTPANLSLLGDSGMRPDDLDASPDDLVIVVRAVDEPTATQALEQARTGLISLDPGDARGPELAPATVSEGLAADGDLTLAAVSTPGTYAAIIAEQALRQGLHVFCFSDNVSIDDEVRLKHLAVDRALLMMGPDCGTAMIDGAPLGFVNAIQPGPVAIVAASGTGAQEISCLLNAAGIGVSQLIGVGGRDLSQAVGGLMTQFALSLVQDDAESKIVILVSKPPSPEVAELVLDHLTKLGKPAVACLLGLPDSDGAVPVRGTLEGAAMEAARLAGNPLHTLDSFPKPAQSPSAAGILGLFTGGTLASEAKFLLAQAGISAEILDLGDDEYTTGRPHPMIDPSTRADRVADVGGRNDIGVVLVDLVLGHGAASDPATPLAEAARTARAGATAAGRHLLVVASVCGTPADPQDLGSQRQILTDAGVIVLPSNAAAARYATAQARRCSQLATQENK